MMSETRPKQIHAFTDDALGDMDATALADAIDSGRVSATEAVEAALARAEKVDGVLNAIEFIDAKRARQRAGRIDAGLGGGRHDHPDAALRGVPSAFKDNVVVAGVPMTQGSEAMPRVSNRRSGKVVTQILGTGIVPIGTTTMPPFGWTATTERPGGNVTRTRGTRRAVRAVPPAVRRRSSRRASSPSRTATTVVARSAFLPRRAASSASNRRAGASSSVRVPRRCR